MINLFNRAFGGFLVFYAGAVVLVLLFCGAREARKAYRLVRFHCGHIKAEVAPLNQDEARALLAIRRRYRDWAPEPVYRQREDSL